MRDMLDASLTGLLRETVDARLLDQAEAGFWPEALWRALDENGFTRALGPESAGGGGAGWSEAFALVRASGKVPTPVPLTETLIANWLLMAANIEPPDGPVTFACDHDLALAANAVSGVARATPWGAAAGHVVAVIAAETPCVVLLRTSDAQRARMSNIAREPRDTLAFTTAAVVQSAVLPEGLPADILLLVGAAARAAQISGALEGLLDGSVLYAQQRTQFGRPIAAFQAIQQQIALLAEHASAATVAADAAFSAADARISDFLIAAAKIVASEAAGIGASIAHAVHGAIGFTDEHALHYSTRRLWAWRSECGGAQYWATRLGDRVCDAGGAALWRRITMETAASAG